MELTHEGQEQEVLEDDIESVGRCDCLSNRKKGDEVLPHHPFCAASRRNLIELVSSAGRVRRVEPTAGRLGSYEEVSRFLDSLDLSRIQDALCTDGLPNTVPIGHAHADFCAKQYKRWLFLRRRFEGELMPPTKDIDMFWHAHILDTYQYEADCDRIFGYYLHHNPYFGSNGEQDEQNWRAAFKNLLVRYKEVYGVPLTRFVPGSATA
jgi:hypothetical protein